MRIIITFLISVFSAVSLSTVYAFDLNALKKLAEDLQKSVPQQIQPEKPKGNNNFNSGKNSGSVSSSSSSGQFNNKSGELSFCDLPDGPFNFVGYQERMFSDTPENVVAQYFNIDPSIAELEIRRGLNTIKPVIGVSYAQAITDGGIWSGKARSRGVELLFDPSMTTLANVISAAGGQKSGFGSADIDIYESKLVLALVAIQLEDLLRDRSLPKKLLKDSRKAGKYGSAKNITSNMAYGISARWALIREGNRNEFDNYVWKSVASQSDKFDSSETTGSRKCRLCYETVSWAASGGIPNWQYAQQWFDGLRMQAQFFKDAPPYNPPGWESRLTELRRLASSLDATTASTFTAAKGLSRAESKGAEAARISREGQELYGAVPDPELDSAIAVLQLETPVTMEKEKQDQLRKSLAQRQVLFKRVFPLWMDVQNAALSMSYSLDSIDRRTEEIYSVVRPVCLVAFAERRAARASDIAMPSASDVSAEESELR